MNFKEIAEKRQSCRVYLKDREVEAEKIENILYSARLSPSACNSQPYHIAVCRGEAAKLVACDAAPSVSRQPFCSLNAHGGGSVT